VDCAVFIHIGDSNVISINDIISIIDYNLISSSVIMEEMMEKREYEGSEQDAKSVVITDDFIYLSTLSVSTLEKRASYTSTINNLEDYSDDLEND